MERVDQVQIRTFRTWSIRKPIDQEFVGVDGVVSAFQTVVAGANETQGFACARRFRVRIKDLLKKFGRFVVLAFLIEAAGDLKHRIWRRCALWKPIDELFGSKRARRQSRD